MPTPPSTFGELDTLLEDATLLGDAAAVAALFEPAGLLAGPTVARGRTAIARVAATAWRDGYVADPRRVLRVHGLAVVAGPRAVTVARCGADGGWRYAIAVVDPGPRDRRFGA